MDEVISRLRELSHQRWYGTMEIKMEQGVPRFVRESSTRLLNGKPTAETGSNHGTKKV